MASDKRNWSDAGDKRVQRRIEEWKRKLVDLSRRNRLLFFRPSRAATLRIVEPPPEEVFERIAIRGREWQFWAPTPQEDSSPEEGSQAPGLFGSEMGNDLGEAAQPGENGRQRKRFFEISGSPERKPAALACNVRDPAELARVLKNLHRRSRTDFMERGVRILHLAFGMLDWRETEHNDPVRSPLILVPAELVRESAQKPFELRPVEGDAVLNPALDVKLRKDFRIELPPIPKDWDETNLRDYLKTIERHVDGHGWSVAIETWTDLFSFHKLVYTSAIS